jgi:hypothetical protein
VGLRSLVRCSRGWVDPGKSGKRTGEVSREGSGTASGDQSEQGLDRMRLLPRPRASRPLWPERRARLGARVQVLWDGRRDDPLGRRQPAELRQEMAGVPVDPVMHRFAVLELTD